MFLLYHGRINDFNDLYPVLGMVASAIDPAMNVKPNLVIVATGFADNVLANLAATFKAPGMLHVFPLTAPKSMNRTGQYDFMLDVAALTGTKIFDPLNDPLQNITSIDQLGKGPRAFTSSRYRSAVLGHRDELLVLERVDELTKQLESGAASEYEKTFLKERVAKLTSGIARLIVTGPSNGETKERRDRAEDAVCAVRGAIKFGALPGGGAVLLHLSRGLRELRSRVSYANQPETLLVAESVMAPALEEPCIRLFTNAGYTEDEARKFFPDITVDGMVFDIAKHEWVKAGTGGLYDATPAVSSALENALSVAGTLGACGGIVTFQRDKELERTEARSSAEFMRNANTNEANERG
jgi:chaperonin GroEL